MLLIILLVLTLILVVCIITILHQHKIVKKQNLEIRLLKVIVEKRE